jgi:nucleoside-diphosphate-sugar epimerase
MYEKSILIIGGTGFVGQSIIDFFSKNNLLKKKIKKIIIVSRGKKKIYLDSVIKKNFQIKIIKKNIKFLKELPFADYVIYCAILDNYVDDYKAVKNYFNLAKKYHLKSKILYTSSGAIYGRQSSHQNKISENYLNNNNKLLFKNKKKNNYSILKLKNEKIFKNLSKFGIKVSIARLFAFAGPRLPLNSNYIIGNFINSILRKKSLKINSNHNIFRSYMYSEIMVKWLLKILFNSKISCPIYNVGSDNAVNIYKIADILSNKYKLSINKNIINYKLVDRYIPNVKKAEQKLNLKNPHNSYQSIIKTINSLKKKNEKIN